MSGSNKDVVGSIKKIIFEFDYEIPMHFHYIIHQEALRCKSSCVKRSYECYNFLNKFILENGLGHCQFQQFFNEIESEYGNLYYMFWKLDG